MRRASISAVLIRPLVFALVRDERALQAFYAATDLTAEIVADPEARVTPAQFCVAWAEAERLANDPALALSIAHTMPQGAFGIVEYVCRSAPTLGDALTQWVRYLKILDDAVEVALVDAGKHASLRVVMESEAPAPASHELCFALVVQNAKTMVEGDFEAAGVRFTHAARTKDIDRYRTFFGADVRFDARHTELLLDRALLTVPLKTHDPNLLAILLPTAEQKLERDTSEPPLTELVRRTLRKGLPRDEGVIEVVAKRLGLTVRSLQRRLRDEGTSFQSLRDETRMELADRYLGAGHSMAEISFLLGFSEPSAFFRAFKRWTGLTPIERREQALAAPLRAAAR